MSVSRSYFQTVTSLWGDSIDRFCFHTAPHLSITFMKTKVSTIKHSTPPANDTVVARIFVPPRLSDNARLIDA